ncbi:MAG: cupredoxin domain-containing protein [Pyrinomonadaceae bacterium]
MKKQIMKSIVAASMILAMLGGNVALANGTNEKASNVAKKIVSAKHPKTVRISVSKRGFSPSSISVEEGFPVTLIFKRKDKKGCGNKVVFPSLGITKTLPVGKPVTVKITPEETGSIAFTCGMGMYKGKIVVQ